MPSRQDQLHSYQFMIQRVVAALVMRETDPAQSPFRRIAGATLIGALLAALSLGAVAAYGLIAPGGSKAWKKTDVVIMEKDSGALFVYREGILHPVVNYASARLIVAQPKPKTVSVARKSIEDAPRGTRLGINGAPASLPGKDKLLNGGWTVCTHRPEGRPQSVLFVGSGLPGGTSLGDRALLVSTPDNSVYVLWKHRRYQVRGDVSAALGLNRTRLEVSAALVNALPAGADLARPELRGRNVDPVTYIPNAKVGNVYVVQGAPGGDQYYVALAAGPQRLTPLQKDLILSDPAAGGRNQPIPITQQAFGQYTAQFTIPDFERTGSPTDLPSTMPAPAELPSGAVCADAGGADDAGEIHVDVPMPDLAGASVTGGRTSTGGVLADRVIVPPGRAVLASASSPNATTGTLCLITDLGFRHVIPSADVASMLGFAGLRPVRLPEDLVALLPSGPALDPAKALQPT